VAGVRALPEVKLYSRLIEWIIAGFEYAHVRRVGTATRVGARVQVSAPGNRGGVALAVKSALLRDPSD
jgi:hypothetical protein